MRRGRARTARLVVALATAGLGLGTLGCAGEERSGGAYEADGGGSGSPTSVPRSVGAPGDPPPLEAASGTAPGSGHLAGTEPGPEPEPVTAIVPETSPTTLASAAAVAVTTMAPSTTSAARPITVARPSITLSVKHPPSGPGVPPIPAYEAAEQERLFFECVVARESSGNPFAINLESGAAGLYQFLQTTWDMVAVHVGRPDLVGVNPALAPIPMQRWFAHELFLWQGTQPWLADGCQLPPPPTSAPSTSTSAVPEPEPAGPPSVPDRPNS